MKTIFRLLILMVLSLFCMPDEVQATAYTGKFSPVADGTYPGSMTLEAQVKQNGNPVAYADLGVFAGEECRAASIADENGMVSLNIQGKAPVALTFKVAIGSAIYTATPSQTVDYQEGAYIGYDSPVIITVGNEVPTGFEITNESANLGGSHKLLRNGQVLILRDGKTFDILGNEIH